MATEAVLSAAPYQGLLKLAPRGTESLGTIVLAHGFGLAPSAYSALASELVVDGWTVYVPALYTVFTSVGDEVLLLNRACTWARMALPRPLVLAGHSRGGQAALMLVLRRDPASEAQGLVLLDPVEGRPGPLGCGMRHVLLGPEQPPIPAIRIPVLVIATEHGCAPQGHDARSLYRALQFAVGIECEEDGENVRLCDVPQVGHMDFIDPSAGFIAAVAEAFLRGSRTKRPALRTLTCQAIRAMFAWNSRNQDTSGQLASALRTFMNT